MSRRSDPRRIQDAWKAAVRDRLIEEQRLSSADAEAWLHAWDVEAARLGLILDGDHWTLGSVWIREQRAKHRTPPTATDHAA